MAKKNIVRNLCVCIKDEMQKKRKDYGRVQHYTWHEKSLHDAACI